MDFVELKKEREAYEVIAYGGKLVYKAVWCYSGHYYPIEENFLEFNSFLEEHKVDLTNVKAKI
ncbi:hypothetical protein DVH24_027541 [Malus domestica]|uniref:Uncharacterized protein n=1 Tax=Malus domestica TaxID=3750 RepID=A0A498HAU3_MALDO|nr:hypothetical protein DVH24_027541 [Malus domestica]